ncbi:MAG TPA: phosphate ABC transporter substrate-binding/OmpA family protein [Armatimonadota bacterium]|nr:phosphate ABC transporter substrate-binding/OmpA family protein [Armatimonadota bacterium]
MAGTQKTGLTGAGKVVVTLIVLGLIGAGGYLLRDKLLPKGASGGGEVDLDAYKSQQAGQQAEKADLTGITTVTEYSFVPSEKLPPVKGTSNYKWNDADPVVVFPINVWIGWLPIVAANHGFAANTESIFYKDYGFKVQLKLIDDPVKARDAFAAGDSHILWGTLDMMVLFAPELMKDSRTAPRIFQQIDWSSGGDGIVVREGIKTVEDLVGKTVTYAQNSPSQYYLNTLLLSAGIQPNRVSHKFTDSAFGASAAFVTDPKIDACVSWAPDIYNIPDKVPGTKLLSTTADASKVIADVWAARADFARDKPKVIRGLVEGIFKGMEMLEKDAAFRDQACQWLAKGYDLPAEDVRGMLQDAHSTNFAENKQFFLNAANPTNFERTWNRITFVYQQLKKLDKAIAFDQVMDFSVIKALQDENKFASQQDTYTSKFAPSDWQRVAEAPLIRQVIRIHFYPNSANLFEPARDEYGHIIQGQLYDPSVNDTLERVAQLAGQFDRAMIVISGHTDDSYRDQVPYELVKKLSLDRAEAVRKALIDKHKFDPGKFKAEGRAWDVPADPNDPHNHALNRRVEIGVYPPEAE